MDEFLINQNVGRTVDKGNPFTIERGRSRDKIVDSIPEPVDDSFYRLLTAVRESPQFTTASLGIEMTAGEDTERYLQLKLPEATPDFVRQVVDEIRKPFGADSTAARLARGVFRAAKVGVVTLDWKSTNQNWFRGDKNLLRLSSDNYQVPEDLELPIQNGLNVSLYNLEETFSFRSYSQTLPHKYAAFLRKEEVLLPWESPCLRVSGYYDYRTRPFTAIRSYHTVHREEVGFLFDLWQGAYESLNPRTVLLSRKQDKKFLFLRWRPNYGNPTFIHHCLNGELRYGKQKCRASFWVCAVDKPAHVFLFRDGVAAGPLRVDGPAGLTGVVHCPPSIKFDLWGTNVVEDGSLEETMTWCQERVDETARCLADNLDLIIERLRCTKLLKSSYADETIARIRSLWGSAT